MWTVLIMTGGRVERVLDPDRRANPVGHPPNSMTSYEKKWFWVVTASIVVGATVAVVFGGGSFFPTGS
jgi:hypothetical protein